MANEINDSIITLRQKAYDLRQQVVALTHLVYTMGQTDHLEKLVAAQKALQVSEEQVINAEVAQHTIEVPTITVDSKPAKVMRGPQTTKIEVKIFPRMDYLPTAYYHLLNPEQDPLVVCEVKVFDSDIKRLRITAYIDGYTANAIQTVEVKSGKPEVVALLPTLFPERARDIRELTKATLNVLAENLDKNNQVEVHETRPIWLLSRNAAIFEINDPTQSDITKRVKDFRHYLGAFVTPNHPRIQGFLREAASKHFEKQLTGELAQNPTSQAEAIYKALKEDTEITYVHAPIAFNPSKGAIGQRVRLPHECLDEKQANCLDGTLLFASLLEALGLHTAIVLIPEHAMVGWTTDEKHTTWSYVDTTLVRTHDFRSAIEIAHNYVASFQSPQLLELSILRSGGVTPIG